MSLYRPPRLALSPRIAFFLVVRRTPHHYLHASALVREATALGLACEQYTDLSSPIVPGVLSARRLELRTDRHENDAMEDLRLRQYAEHVGDTLLIDTDTSLQHDVSAVFDDKVFDVAVADRAWPHLAQGEKMMHEMPFNTGVVFSRSPQFWREVHRVWSGFPDEVRANWMSEQSAFYAVVRTGQFRIKVLPGMIYNYPPGRADDRPPDAVVLHYKGDRKKWLRDHAMAVLSTPAIGG